MGKTHSPASNLLQNLTPAALYAYLVWADQGHRRELLITEATNANRMANLRAAWETVRAHKLTTTEGRRQWRNAKSEPRESG
jgi:hypothetical protein